ncbi:FecR family protein [Flavobacterium aquidurense]|uniref:FecR family protein n=1 Tax=Flavobacterium aquidurense TaxID=362413 RepID=UPI00371E0182
MKNTDSKIPNIIAAYSLKELSAEEFEVLKNWLAEDPENEEMFIGYLKLYKKSRQIGFFQSLDKSIAWNKIVSRVNCTTSEIDQQPVKIIPLRKIPYKFIAAASIAAILFLGIYFSEKNILPLESNNSSKENPVGVIPPGNSKAILTLEDGSEVELKKGSQYSNQNTKVNGTEIVYDENASKTDTKISYNFLTIPRGGTYCVELSDNTKVWLNSESKLKFPVNFKEGYMREVVLEYGEAYFEVSSSTKHKGAGFTVLTKEQEIEVLGTQFNVKAYKDENIISTTLLEGSILLNLADTSQKLVPGEQSVLDKRTKKVTINVVATQYEVGWKNGLFTFKNKSLKDIMQVLSRWYDVDFVFADKKLESIEFKGQINRNQDLESILKLIKRTKYIDAYEIKNKTVVLK